MIRSMTGFGRGTHSQNGREYLVEIKTVNHKYNDISVRTSRTYSFLESKIRETINKKINRGKIDVNVWVEDFGTEGRNVLLDEGLAQLYVDALIKLKDKFQFVDAPSLAMISKIPDIMKVRKEEDDEAVIWNELSTALNIAIDSLIAMREREGEQLKINLLEKTAVLSDLIKNIEERAPKIPLEYKEKLQNRIKELLDDAKVDEGRLELETAIFADRCSVEEEITRFKSHIKQFNRELEANSSIGRKLDFLVQELNREINTIGSKANDLEMTKVVVEAKSEIEKIREQIQNIE